MSGVGGQQTAHLLPSGGTHQSQLQRFRPIGSVQTSTHIHHTLCNSFSPLDVIIVVSDIEEEVIYKALNELKLEINYNLVSIPYSRDFGTADSLRLIKDKVKVCKSIIVIIDSTNPFLRVIFLS